MSLVTHATMLEAKHQKLETMIEQESARPMPDFTVIQTLKKQKLMLKEEILGLAEQMHAYESESGGAA